jgi:hypothetical protein
VIEIVAMALREHGHKTPLNWALTGVVVLVSIVFRLIFGARRRRRLDSADPDE